MPSTAVISAVMTTKMIDLTSGAARPLRFMAASPAAPRSVPRNSGAVSRLPQDGSELGGRPSQRPSSSATSSLSAGEPATPPGPKSASSVPPGWV